MNRLYFFRRLSWDVVYYLYRAVCSLAFGIFCVSIVVYPLSWVVVFSATHWDQEVCNTAAFSGLILDLPVSTSSEFDHETMSAPYRLLDCRNDLDFQRQYALLSTQSEFQNLAPVMDEVIDQLDAFNPSFLDWSHKLSFFVNDFSTYYVKFRAHSDACLAFPMQQPRDLIIRLVWPMPEAFSILSGFWGPYPLIYFSARPTSVQVHKHLDTQYRIFRTSSAGDLEALWSHPGRTRFNASFQATTYALQNVRAHTTGKKNLVRLLKRDIRDHPAQVNRTLDSLGWSRLGLLDLDQEWLSRHPDILDAFNEALSLADAYIRTISRSILRMLRDLDELDKRFKGITAEDVFHGRGAVAMERFHASLEAVLIFPGKLGIMEEGRKKIKERAEQSLGIGVGEKGETEKSSKGGLDHYGAEAKDAWNGREL